MHTQTIEHNGKKLAYDVAGSGPFVVLLHGFGEVQAQHERTSAAMNAELTLSRAIVVSEIIKLTNERLLQHYVRDQLFTVVINEP